MTFEVIFASRAQDDLQNLFVYVARKSGKERAIGFVRRIEDYCLDFSHFPKRGVRRDDLLPGIRIVGFDRRVTIAFHISGSTVTVDRILYGGRNVQSAIEQP